MCQKPFAACVRKLPDPAVIGNAGSFSRIPWCQKIRRRSYRSSTWGYLVQRTRWQETWRCLAYRTLWLESFSRWRCRGIRKTCAGPGEPRPCHRRADMEPGATYPGFGAGEIRHPAGAGAADYLTSFPGNINIQPLISISCWKDKDALELFFPTRHLWRKREGVIPHILPSPAGGRKLE